MKYAIGQRYGNRQTEVENELGQCVCAVWTHRPTNPCAANSSNFQPDPELMKHLHLIVAAPAMLMALNDCIAAYEAHRDNQPTGNLWPDPNHIMWAKLAVQQATTGKETLTRFATTDIVRDPVLVLANRLSKMVPALNIADDIPIRDLLVFGVQYLGKDAPEVLAVSKLAK